MFCKSLFVLCPFYCGLVFSVLLRFTATDYSLGFFKLLAIALYVLRFTTYDNPFVIFKPLVIIYVLQFTASNYPFGIGRNLASALLFLLRLTATDYSFGIFKH